MSILSLAIIGKNNSPLYISCLDIDKEIDLQYRIHSSLDIIEEKINPSNQKQPESRDLYLGLLNSTETYKIYGYITNTKIKFIVVVDSQNTALRENEIRTLFRNIHNLYTNAVSNPFYTPNDQLYSKSFDRSVRSLMTGTI